MAQFKSFEKGIGVNGRAIMSVVEGMGAYRSAAVKLLAEAGLGDAVTERDRWYPQQAWLDVFKNISEKIGDNTIFQIGLRIPENADFPPEIDNLEKALSSIDMAYHMNHRNARGEVLFDPKRSRPMLEGIGHYKCSFAGGEKRAVMECENPYPCAFDRGLIEAMARKFKPKGSLFIRVSHDDSKPCRKNGASACTYLVSW